jgi:aminoglycoside phosphotransferase (APT) family kinase protein
VSSSENDASAAGEGDGPLVYRLARAYPAEQAAAAVERLLGVPVVETARSSVGSSHAVFFVALADGRRGVARVATHLEHALGRELWATERGRLAGAPAPRLLAADLSPADGSPPIAVHERLIGQPGHQVELRPAEREAVLEQMAGIAARVHGVAIEGVGHLAPARDGYAGTRSSWVDFTLEALDQRLGELRALAALPASVERAVRDRFAAGRPRLAAALPPGASGRLVHGDFRLQNALLVREASGQVRVSAVLDFEMALAGDGAVDLAWLGYQDGRGERDLAAILRGYGADRSDPGLQERLVLHRLHYALGHLWWKASFDDRPGGAAVIERIGRLIESG